MNSLTTWNPFREMDELVSRFNRGLGRTATVQASALADWAPSVDIAETEKEYTVKAELAGMKKEDVKISVQNGVLSVSGERRFESEEKDKRHHRVERSYGSFARNFTLPDDVVQDKIEADCNEGVVTIHLPKADIKKAISTQIKVK